MEDKELLKAKGNLARLDKALSDLATKQRVTEGRLAQEHQIIRQSASQRAVLVSKLIDANEEESRKLDKAIDGMDQAIRSSERLAESYQHALKDIANETAAVTSERDKLNQIVAAENNSREFAAWTVAMQENFQAVSAAMEQARLTLGRLTVAAAKGEERFAEGARTWASGRFDQWEHQQANAEALLGFRPALPFYRHLLVHIAPMTRG